MSNPQQSFQQTSGIQRRLRSLMAAVAIAASGTMLIPLAQAGVIYNPATIVDHGTYITDTANHLDWYKFSNAVNTIGWSKNNWLANSLSGWSIANLAQVQGLETQFGWTTDTLTESLNANFGLTEAMAGYLGHTVEFYSGNNFTDGVHMIQAMTSETYFFWNDVTQAYDDERLQVTTSQFFDSVDPSDGLQFLYGDYVDSEYAFRTPGDADELTGIWLSRASVDGGGGAGVDCGRLAPCPVNQVPEPGSTCLVLLGLSGLAVFRRSRFTFSRRIAAA